MQIRHGIGIPSSNKKATGGGGGGNAPPGFDPVLWFQGDSPLNTYAGGAYVTGYNRGSQGGTLTPATTGGPAVAVVNGKNVAFTTVEGGFRYGDQTSLAFLHEPGRDATVTFRFFLDSVGLGIRLFSTKNSAVTDVGFLLEIHSTGDARLYISDGTALTLNLSTGADILAGEHTFQIRKTDTLYEVFIDGVAYLSGTATALATGPSQNVPMFGSTLTDTGQLIGSFYEFMINDKALSNAELTSQLAALDAKWGAFSPSKIPNLHIFLDAANGPVLAPDVSLWPDLSGYKNDIAQSNPAAQPTLMANWHNGQPALFGGPGKFLQNLSLPTPLTVPMTVFLVGDVAQSPGATAMVDGISGADRLLVYTTATTLTALYSGGQAAVLVDPGPVPSHVTVVASATATTLDLQRDGFPVQSASGAAGGAGWTNFLALADYTGGANNPNGLSLVLAYNRELTSTEIANVKAWMASRWNINP